MKDKNKRNVDELIPNLVNYDILTSYGRTALYLALKILKIKNKGVIVPTFTCSNVTDAVVLAGGYPVFVDINVEDLSFNELDLLAKVKSNNVVAIITHHYYGSENIKANDIDNISKMFKLIHIGDYTHSLGIKSNCIGDIIAFSFSKVMTNPAGGGLKFKDPELLEKANQFQMDNRNIFHNFVSNIELFKRYKILLQDRYCQTKRYKLPIYRFPSKIDEVTANILRIFKIYPKYYFYKISNSDLGKEYISQDTRMTIKLQKHLKNTLRLLPQILEYREKITIELNKILPSYLPLENNVFTFYSYLAKTKSEREKHENILRSCGIITRRVWPASQMYWPEQKTKSIKLLEDRMLLFDLECFDLDKIKKIKNVL